LSNQRIDNKIKCIFRGKYVPTEEKDDTEKPENLKSTLELSSQGGDDQPKYHLQDFALEDFGFGQ
jgi:hypothetical protein